MKFHSVIIDDFLDDFEAVRKQAIRNSFDGITNPADGIHYPDVSIQIPQSLVDEFAGKVGVALNGVAKPNAIFLRMRRKDKNQAPHEVHTDKIMGQYTALVYLNTPDQCRGGTAFVEHISGKLSSHPETQEELDLWHLDTNNLDQWTKTGYCPMKSNRCVIFRSDVLHYAEPFGGFGEENDDARLVLTMFLDLV